MNILSKNQNQLINTSPSILSLDDRLRFEEQIKNLQSHLLHIRNENKKLIYEINNANIKIKNINYNLSNNEDLKSCQNKIKQLTKHNDKITNDVNV